MLIADFSVLDGAVSDAQLYDMAGNAFCTLSCMPAQMIAMLCLAWLSQDEDEVDWGRALRGKARKPAVLVE